MESSKAKHSANKDTFSEVSQRLLSWQKLDSKVDVDGEIGAEGRGIIKKLFSPQTNSPDGPDRMVRVLDFLSSKMHLNDGGKLRRMINAMKDEDSVSILPVNEKSTPDEVLRQLLKGEYDKTLDISTIAQGNQIYALALYLYIHTSNDSEQDMMDTFEELIISYNNPKLNRRELDIVGLEAAPLLAKLCTQAIEMYDLGDKMRDRFKEVFEKDESPNESIHKRNARLVIPDRKTA